MIVRYHEMSALMGVGKPGRPITLDDHHKAAWALYTGTGKMEIPRGVDRPFTFRADALPGRPGMHIITVRSPFAFAGAKELSIDLAEGTRLDVEFVYSPFTRSKSAEGKSIRITPPSKEWDENARQRLAFAGMATESLRVTPLPRAKVKTKNGSPTTLVNVTAQAIVTDPIEAADKWMRGISPMRAYGMGQLILLPESASLAKAG